MVLTAITCFKCETKHDGGCEIPEVEPKPAKRKRSGRSQYSTANKYRLEVGSDLEKNWPQYLYKCPYCDGQTGLRWPPGIRDDRAKPICKDCGKSIDLLVIA